MTTTTSPMTLSPHLFVSSPCSPHTLIHFPSSFSSSLFSLSVLAVLLSLSEFCFKSLSLKGRLLLPQTPCGLSSFFFMLLFFFPCICPFFVVFIRSALPLALTMAEPTAHTHILKMTHTKPIVAQPSEWLAGKVKRSVIPSRQMQSLEIQCQPESP